MTRIFWDTMLFIYLLEDNKKYSTHIRELLASSYRRGDILVTSALAVGEVMAGGTANTDIARTARLVIEEMGFGLLPFDDRCTEAFANLRKKERLKAPDAIHLACAAAYGVDLFLTGDIDLLRKRPHIPGIQFIADFEHAPF